MELVGTDDEALAKAAVGVDAEHLQLLAAIAASAAAGEALEVVHVRLDGAAIARPNILHTRADFEHFDAELVPGNARIAEQREFAEVRAGIGAADADAVRAHERFVRTQRRGLVDFKRLETCAALLVEWLSCDDRVTKILLLTFNVAVDARGRCADADERIGRRRRSFFV